MGDTPDTDELHQKLTDMSREPGWVVGKAYVEMRLHAERLERERDESSRPMLEALSL